MTNASHLRVTIALAGALFAAQIVPAQAATEPTDREIARAFVGGFYEAREIDARCELLDPERKARFAEYIEYLRQDTVKEFDAALVAEAEDVGKRYARDPEYLDCGQAAMDRVEDRYDRIRMVVEADKRKPETPQGRQLPAEEPPPDPGPPPGPSEAERNQDNLGMLGQLAKVQRTETRCRFLDEAMRSRVFALLDRMAQVLRNRIADPAAVAKAESASGTESGCSDDMSNRIHGMAENIESVEVMVKTMESLDAMSSSAKRREEAAAAADLSVPLPPPPANRPKPLTRAQKQKALDLDAYARSLRTQRIESRCRFLTDESRARLVRVESRYAELMRLEVADPAAIAKVDAAPDEGAACGNAQRAEVERAVQFLDLTESSIEMLESIRTDESK